VKVAQVERSPSELADQVMMLENATYSVITPEGCAAILWKDSTQAPRAAEELCMTAQHLFAEKIIDKIIPEPEGGAHNDYEKTARYLDSALSERLAEAVSLHSGRTPLTSLRQASTVWSLGNCRPLRSDRFKSVTR
jgi:acetyl-CoA carboxylase alpha subunit